MGHNINKRAAQLLVHTLSEVKEATECFVWKYVTALLNIRNKRKKMLLTKRLENVTKVYTDVEAEWQMSDISTVNELSL